MQRYIAILLGSVLLIPAMAQDRSHARSMVITRYGIAATSYALASQASAQVLARGGSAADAAIAANAVLGVAEPMMNGMGGDLFAIYWDAKSGKLYGLNSSGWAPKGLTIEHLRAKGLSKMPEYGIDTVTVPGAVAGWNALHQRFGRIAWREIFQPAIFYAENGYPVPELIQAFWADADTVLRQPTVLLPHGKAPVLGDVFHNQEVGKALRLVADGGPRAFYEGEIAQAILNTSQALGGTMAADDLAQFSPEWVEPISTTYRGWMVYELPPNGQGMAALEMLNIFEKYPLPEWGFASADAFHIKVEAQKLAYADLYRNNADPRFAKVLVAGIISKSFAAERASTIDMKQAHCDVTAGNPTPFGGDTIY